MTSVTFQKAQLQSQDDAAIDLQLKGIEDGFNRSKPRSRDWGYLEGYSKGCRQRAVELRRQARLLDEDAMAVERKANQLDNWLDQLFEDD